MLRGQRQVNREPLGSNVAAKRLSAHLEIPFWYTKKRHRAAFMRFFEVLARSHGLSVKHTANDRLPELRPSDLDKIAVTYYWSPSEFRSLQHRRVAKLTPRKLAVLTRSTPILRLTYSNSKGNIRLEVRMAARNCYRCFGAWTWMESDLMLPGGLATMKSPRRTLSEDIRRRIIAFQGRRSPQRITRCWRCGQGRTGADQTLFVGGASHRICANCGNLGPVG